LVNEEAWKKTSAIFLLCQHHLQHQTDRKKRKAVCRRETPHCVAMIHVPLGTISNVYIDKAAHIAAI
jgi:hypothetical protein